MTLLKYAPLAQLDRASDYGSEGQGFEFSAARQNVGYTGVFFCYKKGNEKKVQIAKRQG